MFWDFSRAIIFSTICVFLYFSSFQTIFLLYWDFYVFCSLIFLLFHQSFDFGKKKKAFLKTPPVIINRLFICTVVLSRPTLIIGFCHLRPYFFNTLDLGFTFLERITPDRTIFVFESFRLKKNTNTKISTTLFIQLDNS